MPWNIPGISTTASTARRNAMQAATARGRPGTAQDISWMGSVGSGPVSTSGGSRYDQNGVQISGGAGDTGWQNAGSRRQHNSSVNWNAFGNIGNFLDTAGTPAIRQQRADYLNSLGIMPTYNGIAYDQIQENDPRLNYSGRSYTAGGSGNNALSGLNRMAGMQGTPVAGGWSNPMFAGDSRYTGRPSGASSPAAGRSGGANFAAGSLPRSGGAGGMLGTPAAFGGGGGLEGQVDSTLSRLIGQGGSPYSASQRAGLVAQQQDAVNRGTQDRLQDARLDAARRGVDPSSLGSREDEIRARGTADSAQARLGAETTLSREAMQNLMSILGNANASIRDRRQAEILLGQLEAQLAGGGAGGLGINFMLGGNG